MKGIVFTEFLEMVENTFGLETAENTIEWADLANGGAYTAVGTYKHDDLLRMVAGLSVKTGIPVEGLVRAFGEHLFGRFAVTYKRMLDGSHSALEFLSGIETKIHREVLKLYPEAELPRFECRFVRPGCLEMMYTSARSFGDLAEGLMRGCVQHFGEEITITREDLRVPFGSAIRFTLTKL
jgi:hypothetical protein